MLRGLLLLAALLFPAASSVRVSFHFMSLCHECQMHVAAFNNNVVTGALEASPTEAGVLEQLELSIDYYGNTGPDGTCESGQMSPHGPQQCQIDRYHVCAQDMLGGTAKGAGMKWFPFVHCKCHDQRRVFRVSTGVCDAATSRRPR